MLTSENDMIEQIGWVGEDYGQRNFAAGEAFSNSEVPFEGTKKLEWEWSQIVRSFSSFNNWRS
jgi:hypothetical protein